MISKSHSADACAPLAHCLPSQSRVRDGIGPPVRPAGVALAFWREYLFWLFWNYILQRANWENVEQAGTIQERLRRCQPHHVFVFCCLEDVEDRWCFGHGILLEAQSIPGHPPVADVHLLALSLAVSNYSHSMASLKLQDKPGRQSIAIYCNLCQYDITWHQCLCHSMSILCMSISFWIVSCNAWILSFLEIRSLKLYVPAGITNLMEANGRTSPTFHNQNS